jgi:hypothetical protein
METTADRWRWSAEHLSAKYHVDDGEQAGDVPSCVHQIRPMDRHQEARKFLYFLSHGNAIVAPSQVWLAIDITHDKRVALHESPQSTHGLVRPSL